MNAPPFEMAGLGLLAIAFILILLFLIGACVVFAIINLINKLKELK
jgi:hypothetical protein